MKKMYVLITIVVLIISCKSEKKDAKTKSEPVVNMDFIKVFEGRIDNQFDYYAKLKSNSGNISGSYFYKNKCQKIPIKGNLDSLGNIRLKEFGENDKLSGIFNGKMVNEQKFEGHWSKNNQSKKYPFYFIETSESFDSALENCKEIRKSKALTDLVLDKIELLSFPATKESGKAWDNAFGGYKSDIYVSVIDFSKNLIYKQSDYFNNQKNSDLPLEFEFSNLKLPKEQYKEGISIKFYDHDSATGDDLLGFIAFDTFKTHYDSKKTTQIIEENGIKAKLKFHYE